MNPRNSLCAPLPWAAFGLLTAITSAAVPQDPDGTAGATAPAVSTGLDAMLSAPIISTHAERLQSAGPTTSTDDASWIRGRGWKAAVSSQGFRYTPAVGQAVDASIEWRLASVELGGDVMDATPSTVNAVPRRASPDVVSVGRQVASQGASLSLSESYRFDLDTIEQTFTFESLPARAELRVSLDVATELSVEAQPDGSIRFFRGSLEVDYSEAFAVDANGVKTPIETRLDGERIELIVSESIVSQATLPLTIDPVITVSAPDLGFGNDGFPEAAWNKVRGRYVVVFEDRITSSDGDIYEFEVNLIGNYVPASLRALDISSVDHERPRLAVHASDGRMMAVAVGRTQPGQNRRVYSMPFRFTGPLPGQLQVGPINQPNEIPGFRDCAAADVGARSTSDAENAFLVVWQSESFNFDGDVRGRFISSDGTMGSPTLNFAMDSNNSILPRVSPSTGDPAFPDGTFNVVWIEDDDGDGRGRVRMRRTNPATENIGNNILVHSSPTAVEAVVTSNLSKELELSGERSAIVGYVVQASSGSTMTSSTVARLVKLSGQAGIARVISDMEDVRPDYLQADLDIATDGLGFMMSYTERTTVGMPRAYMCSGGIMDRSGSAFSVTLSERHQILETTSESARTPAICTRFDGGEYTGGLADDGACVWQSYDGFTEFSLRFARLDLDNNIPQFGDRPVGVQFCAAERNAGGQTGWIHAEAPDQSVNSTIRFVAEDLQLFATGYLIVADTSGFVMGPGGSAGNLCVIGAGRYVNDVASAGTTGQITTTVDPLALPQPTGFVSAVPGDTWYFQYWYRDIQFGLPTSNFTNAAAVFFVP